MDNWRRALYLGMILIAFGIVMTITSNVHSVGSVFVAVGGLFFIIGMARRKKVQAQHE